MSIPKPVFGPGSVWRDISDWFDDAGDALEGAGDKLSSIPVIGWGIHVYFYNAATVLYWIRDAFRTVDSIVYEIQTFARELQQFNGVIPLISKVWTQFNDIRNYPIRWVNDRIAELSSDLARIIKDPVGFVRDRVRDVSNDLGKIIVAPADWVRDKITEIFSELPKINQNFLGYLRDIIKSHIPALGGLFDDVNYWVKERISIALGVPISFFEDPWGGFTQHLLNQVENYFDRYRPQIYRMGEYILYRLWEGK